MITFSINFSSLREVSCRSWQAAALVEGAFSAVNAIHCIPAFVYRKNSSRLDSLLDSLLDSVRKVQTELVHRCQKSE